MFQCFHRTSLVGAIAFAMGISHTHAQPNNDSQPTIKATLNPLVITATRSEEKIKNVPARISIIEPQILEQSPISELPHLLISDAAINMVQTGGFGQQASIFTRGTNSTHTLILRDGIRLNAPSSGMASLSFLDTTDIKQIEVLKGPASVLYGTDAIGGVIQLISKTPEKNAAFITGEIAENNTYKTILGADFAENGIYTQIRGQRLETDGTEVTNQKNTEKAAYDQKGFSAKIGMERESYATSIDYSTNQGFSTYDNYGNLLSQNFENEILNLKGRVNFTDTFSVNARLSQFKDDLIQNDKPDYVYNTTQEAELFSKWQFDPAQNILMGISHKNIKSDIYALGEGYEWQGIYYPGEDVLYNQEIHSTGYYAQHQYQTDKLNTQVGVRVEDHENFGTHTVGQVAARYQLFPNTSIYSNIGTAFRAPTNNDLYAVAWGANPNLNPEKSISYELGVDQHINDQLSLGFSLYRNEVDDLIVYTNQLNNVDKAKFTGGEVSLNWQQNELFLNLGYAYVQAKNAEDNTDLTRRPRHSATLTTGWQDGEFGVSTAISAKSDSTDFTDSATNFNPSNIPGYVTLDLNAYWNVNPKLKLFTNVQNLGDVKYKTSYNGNDTYYINGGRLASAGVTFKY
ncbi:TonB-dependent receptor plug domain-containing protein [Acinetobacter sp. TSRC1-2]|uniref:TonB-dependent receptor plug domain-containing protein n=1 Tax=unclassified Acinetobacter TaxID=196816 RepID=UPI003CF775D0